MEGKITCYKHEFERFSESSKSSLSTYKHMSNKSNLGYDLQGKKNHLCSTNVFVESIQSNNFLINIH